MNDFVEDKREFVSGVITNKKGNVLLLKRKDNLNLDPGKYDFCSGHIKKGEAPMQAMYRELNEEIGLKPEQVKIMDSVGIIETPHEKFLETLCYVYNIEIDLSIDKLNKMIHEVENPEMEEAIFLEDINELRQMISKIDSFRLMETKQMKMALEAIQQKIIKRKGNEKDLCEER